MARATYRDALIHYYTQHSEQLDEDSKRRLHSNPLRILDSKNPDMQTLNIQAPKLIDYIDAESAAHFSQLRALLDAADIRYEVNPCLVRGLDYYNRTVFEWVTTELGAQGTVCAGGHYDGLVEQLGGKTTPAIGMAIGLERLLALVQTHSPELPARKPTFYLVLVGEAAVATGLCLAEKLREQAVTVDCHLGGGTIKAQMKKADKSGAEYAVIIGDDEVRDNTITLKSLRGKGEQETMQQKAFFTEKLPYILQSQQGE